MKDINISKAVNFLTEFFDMKNISIKDGPSLEELIEFQKDRVHTLTELAEKSVFFYSDFDEYDNKLAAKHLIAEVLEPMSKFCQSLEELNDWESIKIKNIFESTINQYEIDFGMLAQPVRVAITGTGISPSIDQTLYLLGKAKSLVRLHRAIDHIKNNTAS